MARPDYAHALHFDGQERDRQGEADTDNRDKQNGGRNAKPGMRGPADRHGLGRHRTSRTNTRRTSRKNGTGRCGPKPAAIRRSTSSITHG